MNRHRLTEGVVILFSGYLLGVVGAWFGAALLLLPIALFALLNMGRANR